MDNESEKQKSCKRKSTRKIDDPSLKFKMWQWLLRVADVRAIWRHYDEASNSWSRWGDGSQL
jgi:hypothetical protein